MVVYPLAIGNLNTSHISTSTRRTSAPQHKKTHSNQIFPSPLVTNSKYYSILGKGETNNSL